MTRGRILAAGAVATLAAAVLIVLEFEWIVGPPSWRWSFTSNPLWPRALPAVFLFGLLLLLGAAWTRAAGERRDAGMLAGAVLLAFLIEMAFLALSPFGLLTLPLMHAVPYVTGYFYVARAARGLHELLVAYPTLVEHFPLHVKTHPPGLVAINSLLLEFFRGSPGATSALLSLGRALGVGPGAIPGLSPPEMATLWAAGLAVIAASRLALVPAFLLARRIWGASEARAAVLLLAVVPSSLLFSGEYDTAFPLLLLTALLFVGRGRGPIALLAAGAIVGTLGLMTFVAAFFLLLAGIADLALCGERDPRRVLLRLAALGAGFAIPLLLFQLATGCSIPAVFLAAFKVQHEVLIPEQRRTWLTWVFWNLQDFFLFLGPAAAVLFACEAAAAVGALRRRAAAPAFTIAVLVFLALLDLSGLIPAETSRVWSFLVAPVLIAALARPLPGGRAGLVALLCLQFAFALLAKGRISMIEVRLPG